jgi:hypothetical protein
MASNGNFCVLNPLMGLDDDGTSKLTFSNGNLRAENTANGIQTMGTMAVKSGKWYYEERYDADANINDARLQVGVQALGTFSGLFDGEIYTKRRSTSSRSQGTHVYYLRPNYQGGKLSHPTSLSWDYGNNESGSSNTGIRVNAVGDIYMIALDLDNYKFYIGRNGTWYSNNTAGATGSNTDITQVNGWSIESEWQGSFWTPVLWIAGASSGTAGYFNFGQDSTFGGQETAGGNTDANGFGDFKYSVPSGYQAWTSANLPISNDIDPAQTDDDYIGGKQHNTIVYTGSGSGQSISGLGFKPDMVWIQNYSSQNQTPRITDSSRGVTKTLQPPYTSTEGTESGVTAFGTDGFTLGSATGGFNTSSASYVAWCWRANGGTTATNSDGNVTSTVQANQAAGFSIVTYTGTGSSGATVGHGLGAAPKFMIIKNRDYARNWACYHVFDNSSGQKALLLNSNSTGDVSNYWNGTQPTSSVFSLGGETEVNKSSDSIVAYCWAEIEGFSKFGGWTASGNENGGFIQCGFKPKLVVIKGVSATNHWMVFDTARSSFNPIDNHLKWNSDGGETTETYRDIDFLSNGFKIRSDNGALNHPSGDKYVFMAWGDVPFKYNNTF